MLPSSRFPAGRPAVQRHPILRRFAGVFGLCNRKDCSVPDVRGSVGLPRCGRKVSGVLLGWMVRCILLLTFTTPFLTAARQGRLFCCCGKRNKPDCCRKTPTSLRRRKCGRGIVNDIVTT